MILALAIFLSVVCASAAAYGSAQLLARAWLSGLERQRKLRREFVEQLVDELAEIRAGFNEYLKHQAQSRSFADVFETCYADFKGGDPSIVSQGLALWLGALAGRLSPPDMPEEPTEPMPINILRWINEESEEWARQGTLARAKELYIKLGSWEAAGVALTSESGAGFEE